MCSTLSLARSIARTAGSGPVRRDSAEAKGTRERQAAAAQTPPQDPAAVSSRVGPRRPHSLGASPIFMPSPPRPRIAALRRGLHVTTWERDFGQYLRTRSNRASRLEALRPTRLLALDARHRAAAQVPGALATDSALVRTHVEGAGTSNEIPAAQALPVSPGGPAGAIITLYALHCKKEAVAAARRPVQERSPRSQRIGASVDPLTGIPGHVQSLEARAQAAGLAKLPFAARKGDVLVWHADLAHGGNPVSADVTRKSIVTHYCPKHLAPLFTEGAGLPAAWISTGTSIRQATIRGWRPARSSR